MPKTGHVLHYLPKSVQKKAKADLHEIWMAETKEEAVKAFDHFFHKYQSKYPRATDCLKKDQEVLLTFYDFPAEYWTHLRTTNPIGSTLATIRLRTDRTRNCGLRVTVLSVVLQLFCSAEKRWRKLNGTPRLAEVVKGVKFVDGIRQKEDAA
jgi:transposase-like protein